MIPTLIFALFACTGSTDSGGKTDTTDSAATDTGAGDATAGAEVFSANCASCHGADGSGGFGPNLAEIAGEGAADEIEGWVRDGGGDMPSFSGSLSDTQIADVVAFVLTIGT